MFINTVDGERLHRSGFAVMANILIVSRPFNPTFKSTIYINIYIYFSVFWLIYFFQMMSEQEGQ